METGSQMPLKILSSLDIKYSLKDINKGHISVTTAKWFKALLGLSTMPGTRHYITRLLKG